MSYFSPTNLLMQQYVQSAYYMAVVVLAAVDTTVNKRLSPKQSLQFNFLNMMYTEM